MAEVNVQEVATILAHKLGEAQMEAIIKDLALRETEGLLEEAQGEIVRLSGGEPPQPSDV